MIVPSIWEQDTFLTKLGPDKESQMWCFQDRGNRDVCLIPEVTGIIQQEWRNSWSKSWCKPSRLFYVSRCYRYERPQQGRYREFTQIGVEVLGSSDGQIDQEVQLLLQQCLRTVGVQFEFHDSVTRGLSYYVNKGFEASCACLGAQKQVAGGGRYAEGVGWAMGVERVLLALDKQIPI